MNFPDVKSGRDLQDAFEFLFEKYSSLPVQQLPRFKKRRKTSQNSSGRLHSTSSTETASLATQVQNGDKGGTPDNNHKLAHQASFSSGVFSIDSDHDILPDGDAPTGTGRSEEGKQTSFTDLPVAEEDSPPEQESGIVSHQDSRRGTSSLPEPDYQRDVKETAASEDLEQSEEPNASMLTDEDVLFMMYKPRLVLTKKKRKKQKQKRKLDLDDLWVKGQHRWTVPGKETEIESARLFLDRNLRRGRLSLENYICTLRKMRIKRKNNNNNHSTARLKSSSGSNSHDNTTSGCRLKRASVSKARKTVKPKKEEVTKTSNSAKTLTRSRDGKTSKTSKLCQSKRKGMMAEIQSSVFDISSSDSTSTQTQNPSDVPCGEKAGGINRDDSDSEDSIINFVSLTPRNTKRRRLRPKMQRRRGSSTSLLDLEASGSRRREEMRMTQHEPTATPSNQWDDWDGDYQPLFGQSGHCGGVWQSIIEESS